MATIGQQLFQPEAGWKRIDDTDDLLIKSTNSETDVNANNSTSVTLFDNDSINLLFMGTKIRLIARVHSSYYSNQIAVKINNEIHRFDTAIENSYQTLVFEKIDLNKEIHSVEIFMDNLTTFRAYTGNDKAFCLDCIDIDANGYILPELSREYEFPIAVIEEDEVAGYASSLINGEEQLLITPLGNLYLTNGNKSYIEVGVSKAKYQELENRVASLEQTVNSLLPVK